MCFDTRLVRTLSEHNDDFTTESSRNSHFPTQAHAEESEEGRWLDWDRGNTIFTSSAKWKAESLRAAGYI